MTLKKEEDLGNISLWQREQYQKGNKMRFLYVIGGMILGILIGLMVGLFCSALIIIFSKSVLNIDLLWNFPIILVNRIFCSIGGIIGIIDGYKINKNKEE